LIVIIDSFLVLDQAIALKPKDAMAFGNRGVTYANLGEHQKAINDYDQAIAINPKDARSFYNRGLSYRKLEKEEKAIKDFKKAQDLDPSIIAKEQIELIEKELSEKIKKTQASNKEVQNFQEILAVLKEEHKKEEQWHLPAWVKILVGMRHHFHVSLVQTFLTLPHDYLLQYAMPWRWCIGE
jgi:tetratricopeptide (TPR) repeat protein